MDKFILHSNYSPTGDQPEAIDALAKNMLAKKDVTITAIPDRVSLVVEKDFINNIYNLQN